MTALLYCVAVLLILAGAAAGLYGADNIRAESGSAWLQTGGALFAIGFVVLALASALRELKRIRRALTEISDEPEAAPAAQPRLPEPPVVAPPTAIPPAATTIPPAATVIAPEPDRDSEPAGEKAEAANRHEVEPPAPEPEARVLGPDAHAGEDAAREDAVQEDAVARRQTFDRDREPVVETQRREEPAPEPEAPPPAPPTVVATYTSGGVNYFMYSNGCIEAELEKGRYRFNSMAELRTYVETGEGGTLIAPASGSPAPASSAAS
jgi:hypothetical protein